MNRPEAQQVANSIDATIYLYANGDHAAAGSTLASELCAAGLHVVAVVKPSIAPRTAPGPSFYDRPKYY